MHNWFKSYSDFAGICQEESKDYSTLRLLVNCNLSWESPKISTSQHQTPDKGIGTPKCATQEVLEKVLSSTKSVYVKYRGGKCEDFGASRCTVVFLNND